MPLARSSSATSPFTDCDRMVEAAATAALAAAARTSASAWASASAILLSAVLVRRGAEAFLFGLFSAPERPAPAPAVGVVFSGPPPAPGRPGLFFPRRLGGPPL